MATNRRAPARCVASLRSSITCGTMICPCSFPRTLCSRPGAVCFIAACKGALALLEMPKGRRRAIALIGSVVSVRNVLDEVCLILKNSGFFSKIHAVGRPLG
jgi:hypothetical protein